MNLVLKLSPKGNYFTEELVGILLTEFKLFISFWKRFDLYFPLLKPKNRARFLLPFRQNMNVWKQISVKGHEVHWGTVWYLMNWIKVVYFKLKEIWMLFSNAKAKKPSSFFTSLDERMKANLSQKAMKLGPNDNYFTEELVV